MRSVFNAAYNNYKCIRLVVLVGTLVFYTYVIYINEHKDKYN